MEMILRRDFTLATRTVTQSTRAAMQRCENWRLHLNYVLETESKSKRGRNLPNVWLNVNAFPVTLPLAPVPAIERPQHSPEAGNFHSYNILYSRFVP